MNSIVNIIIETRPINVLLTAVSVWIGYFFSSDDVFSGFAAIACASAACICAGGNIVNDFFDISIDRINKPERPYAAGRIPRRVMILSGGVFFLAGLILSFFLRETGVVIAILAITGLLIYNLKAKRIMLLSNILIGILSGSAFLYGGVAGGSMRDAVVPALFAVIYHFGREVLKDIEDREGDMRLQIITFPVRYGNTAALGIASVIFASLVAFTIIPFLYLGYSVFYFITVLIGVDLLIIILLVRHWVFKDSVQIKKTNNMLKAGMIFGLLALVLK